MPALKPATIGQKLLTDCGQNRPLTTVKAIDSMTAIVNYVIAHDRAKTIIEEDYRNLPKHSKKQKKYYRQAKNRVKRKAIRNVYSIFDMLENKNPELKYAYKEVAYC